MKSLFVSVICLALLAGCSEKAPKAYWTAPQEADAVSAPANKFGMAESLVPAGDAATRVTVGEEPPRDGASAAAADPAVPVQIAYTYRFSFRIGSDQIGALQKAHIALCEAMGPKCRVLRTSVSRGDEAGSGEAKLQVAAAEAGAFEKALSEPAAKLGGELASSEKEGEDLSKTIVDTEAKLKSRLILREKLTDILRGNRGSVDELIKAEKAVADVNEEIDTAASELKGYRSRVQFSDVNIDYQPTFAESQVGFARPILTATSSIGTTLGITIAALVYAITALVPITLFVLALRWVLHRFGLRIRFWRKAAKAESEAG